MTDIGSILIFIAFQSRCTIYRAHLDRSRSSVAESNSFYWSEAGTGRGEEFARYSLLHKNPLLSKSKHFNFNLYINILFFVSTLILFRICRHDPVWRQIASTVKKQIYRWLQFVSIGHDRHRNRCFQSSGKRTITSGKLSISQRIAGMYWLLLVETEILLFLQAFRNWSKWPFSVSSDLLLFVISSLRHRFFLLCVSYVTSWLLLVRTNAGCKSRNTRASLRVQKRHFHFLLFFFCPELHKTKYIIRWNEFLNENRNLFLAAVEDFAFFLLLLSCVRQRRGIWVCLEWLVWQWQCQWNVICDVLHNEHRYAYLFCCLTLSA